MKYTVRKSMKKDLRFFNFFAKQEGDFAYANMSNYFKARPDLAISRLEYDKLLKDELAFSCVSPGNKVVGMLILSRKRDHGYLSKSHRYAEVHTFWIDESFQIDAESIGKNLFWVAKMRLRKIGIREIRAVEFVDADKNSDIYRLCGFKAISTSLMKDIN